MPSFAKLFLLLRWRGCSTIKPIVGMFPHTNALPKINMMRFGNAITIEPHSWNRWTGQNESPQFMLVLCR